MNSTEVGDEEELYISHGWWSIPPTFKIPQKGVSSLFPALGLVLGFGVVFGVLLLKEEELDEVEVEEVLLEQDVVEGKELKA